MTAHPFEAHIPRLRRYALALRRDRVRADDLVQDTLERALRKFTLFRSGSDLRAWLFTIMHNVHVNQLRSSARQAREVEFEESDATVSSIDDATAVRDLVGALDRLPDEQREIVLLVGLEHLSYEQTARVMGVPIGTVMSRLSRARERLRVLMAGEAGTQLRRIK